LCGALTDFVGQPPLSLNETTAKTRHLHNKTNLLTPSSLSLEPIFLEQIPKSPKSLSQEIETRKFNFEKQIDQWITSQENPQDPNSGVEDDRTEKLDIRGLMLSQPKNMEAELRFHKVWLKFGYVPFFYFLFRYDDVGYRWGSKQTRQEERRGFVLGDEGEGGGDA
jgi:hypothetical protein